MLREINVPLMLKFLTMFDRIMVNDLKTEVTLFLEDFPMIGVICFLRNSTLRNVHFVNIAEMFIRSYVQPGAPQILDPFRDDPNFYKGKKWSYHNMIRFWFSDIFELSGVMDNVEYFLRLDHDSKIDPISFDIFQLLSNKQAVYLANEKRKETPRVVKQLKVFTEAYVTNSNIKPVNPVSYADAFPDGNKAHTYYNNFEVIIIFIIDLFILLFLFRLYK